MNIWGLSQNSEPGFGIRFLCSSAWPAACFIRKVLLCSWGVNIWCSVHRRHTLSDFTHALSWNAVLHDSSTMKKKKKCCSSTGTCIHMMHDLVQYTISAVTKIAPYKLASRCIKNVAKGFSLFCFLLWTLGQSWGLLAVQTVSCGIGCELGTSIWGFPYDPLLASPPPLLFHGSHLLSAWTPPNSAAIIKLKEVSLSARAGSLTLLVAKTRSGAEQPTVTLAHCRTIASHGTFKWIT